MVNLTYKNYDWNICVFVADTVDDFSDLPTMTTQGTSNSKMIPPCGMGSSVYTKDGKMYRLCGNNSWEEVPSTESITRAELEAVLANYVSKDSIVNVVGDATDKVMSQKAVSDILNNLNYSVTDVLLAENWIENIYSFEEDYPAENYDITIGLNGDTISTAQKEAFDKAQLVGLSNQNDIKAMGEIPDVNIPILIRVVKKI